jgi:hypothetical protein
MMIQGITRAPAPHSLQDCKDTSMNAIYWKPLEECSFSLHEDGKPLPY